MSDLFKPIQFYAKNTCPMCREGHLLVTTIESYGSILGPDGLPADNIPLNFSERVYCPKCNYQDYVKDPNESGEGIYHMADGSYRYLTEAEKIHYMDIGLYKLIKSKARVAKHVGLEEGENPFIKEKDDSNDAAGQNQ